MNLSPEAVEPIVEDVIEELRKISSLRIAFDALLEEDQVYLKEQIGFHIMYL